MQTKLSWTMMQLGALGQCQPHAEVAKAAKERAEATLSERVSRSSAGEPSGGLSPQPLRSLRPPREAGFILGGLRCVAVLAVWLAMAAWGGDWPQYRGGGHDGISTDRIRQSWPVEGPSVLWRVSCTNGLSSLAVSGGRVFTQISRHDGTGRKETCVALDAATGVELWARSIDAGSYGGGVGSDDGPRSTPSVAGGRVFVLSSFLGLQCLNATNGSVIWSKDLRALYSGSIIDWQNAASPLVDNDLVFVNANTASQSLFAFRASDGGVAWRVQTAGNTHASPVAAVICGVPQIVFPAQSALYSLNRTNGTLLWKASYPFRYDTSLAASPVVYSNLVFISANYTMGSFATRISYSNSTWKATPAWTNSAYKAHWMTPVCHQGYLYGMFGSVYTAPLKCIDIQTGLQKWSQNGFGRGGTIIADNHILALTERGDLALIDPNPTAYTQIARFTLFPDYDADTNKCWNVPAVCDGRIYARSTAQAVCLDTGIPSLKFLSPVPLAGSRLRLSIGTDTGGAIDSNRLAKIEVRVTTNLALAFTNWSRLTNALVYANGQIRLDNVDGSKGGFYIATETP